MVLFSKTTIQMHSLKADGCNKIQWTKASPLIQQEGAVPLLHVALGFSAASLGTGRALSCHLAKGCCHVVLSAFLWQGDALPATRLAWGPQEGGSHRIINGRSLLPTLCAQKDKSV